MLPSYDLFTSDGASRLRVADVVERQNKYFNEPGSNLALNHSILHIRCVLLTEGYWHVTIIGVINSTLEFNNSYWHYQVTSTFLIYQKTLNSNIEYIVFNFL